MNTEARIGLIIPSSNRLTEPQFHAYAPPGVGIHVTRLRMTGKWRKPFSELKGPLAEAAAAISYAVFCLKKKTSRITPMTKTQPVDNVSVQNRLATQR